MGKLFRFIKYSKYKPLMVRAFFLSAKYRRLILKYGDNRARELQKRFGIEGQESPEKEDIEVYRYAHRVSYAVDHICSRTTWESKCLVRALVAQNLLKRKNINSTLYLGCKMEEDKMVAHAWIRCGEMFVSGGHGEGYGMVAKFVAF
ncbi:MAG: lasso peptide biosynthesis B2 protein [Lachnospiraceae bacterium]